MENIISYFGTYTPAADGAIANFKFEYLCTLGFAAIVIFLGRAIVAHSAALRKYAIPAPVVSGIIFSLLISAIKMTGTVSISFDAKVMKDLCQNLFFLCVGFGFSAKMLRHAGGKLCVMIAFAACLQITCQDVLGVAAGTLGNVMGSLIGGPVAAFLIAKHGLKADPNDKPEAKATGKAPELDNTKMIMMFAMCLLLAALGMPIYCLLDNIPMIEMPKFIGCLFAGAIARNIMEAANIKFYVPEVDAIEHMFLELYLALVLMTTDFTKLAPVVGQMGIILVAQAILMALFGIFVSFNLFGRDYGAAVMTAGNIGWGCGSGPNAVANEKAVMDQYGWHNIAWVLYPSFAVIIDDIYNPIFLSIFGGLFKG